MLCFLQKKSLNIPLNKSVKKVALCGGLKNKPAHSATFFMILFNGILRDFCCKKHSILFKYKVHVSYKIFQLISVY